MGPLPQVSLSITKLLVLKASDCICSGWLPPLITPARIKALLEPMLVSAKFSTAAVFVIWRMHTIAGVGNIDVARSIQHNAADAAQQGRVRRTTVAAIAGRVAACQLPGQARGIVHPDQPVRVHDVEIIRHITAIAVGLQADVVIAGVPLRKPPQLAPSMPATVVTVQQRVTVAVVTMPPVADPVSDLADHLVAAVEHKEIARCIHRHRRGRVEDNLRCHAAIANRRSGRAAHCSGAARMSGVRLSVPYE